MTLLEQVCAYIRTARVVEMAPPTTEEWELFSVEAREFCTRWGVVPIDDKDGDR